MVRRVRYIKRVRIGTLLDGNLVLIAQEGLSGQNGAEEPEEGRKSRRASSRQKITRVLLTKGVSRTRVSEECRAARHPPRHSIEKPGWQ